MKSATAWGKTYVFSISWLLFSAISFSVFCCGAFSCMSSVPASPGVTLWLVSCGIFCRFLPIFSLMVRKNSTTRTCSESGEVESYNMIHFCVTLLLSLLSSRPVLGLTGTTRLSIDRTSYRTISFSAVQLMIWFYGGISSCGGRWGQWDCWFLVSCGLCLNHR